MLASCIHVFMWCSILRDPKLIYIGERPRVPHSAMPLVLGISRSLSHRCPTVTCSRPSLTMSATILVSAFPPFQTLSLSLPLLTPISSLDSLLRTRYPSLPAADSHDLAISHPTLQLTP